MKMRHNFLSKPFILDIVTKTVRFNYIQFSIACVAGVERGRGIWARERACVLPRACSRALIPFPFPFEVLEGKNHAKYILR